MFIKKYLSYSQYSCYLFSPAEYIKRYLEGIKQESKYLDFGSLIHKALESGTDDENIKKVISQIPIPEMKEKDYLIDFYGIPIFGKIDGLTIKNGSVRIDEYKTGKNTWTQKKS